MERKEKEYAVDNVFYEIDWEERLLKSKPPTVENPEVEKRKMRRQRTLEKKLFVSDVPYFMKYKPLFEHFSTFGVVKCLTLWKHEATLQSTKTCIVTMDNAAEAIQAIRSYDAVHADEDGLDLIPGASVVAYGGFFAHLDIFKLQNTVHIYFPRSCASRRYMIIPEIESFFGKCGINDMLFAKGNNIVHGKHWLVTVCFTTPDARDERLKGINWVCSDCGYVKLLDGLRDLCLPNPDKDDSEDHPKIHLIVKCKPRSKESKIMQSILGCFQKCCIFDMLIVNRNDIAHRRHWFVTVYFTTADARCKMLEGVDWLCKEWGYVYLLDEWTQLYVPDIPEEDDP